jgi:alkyl sulfatase BDS1-like metallo-beta-lactamase superfamily hydrolase
MSGQTLRLVNRGYTGTEIAERIEMPPELARAWHTHGNRGAVGHNVKAIYRTCGRTRPRSPRGATSSASAGRTPSWPRPRDTRDAGTLRLDGPRAWSEKLTIDWRFADLGQTYRTMVSSGTSPGCSAGADWTA